MADWYCLTSFNAVRSASDLREAGFVAYTPQERVTRRRRSNRFEVSRPLYVGYGFVLCADTDLAAVRAAGTIHDFVRYTDAAGARNPVPIAPELVTAIILAEAFGAFDHTDKTPAAYRPRKGERVRIGKGMFAGYFGRVIALSRRKAKLGLEKGGRVDVDAEALEAA